MQCVDLVFAELNDTVNAMLKRHLEPCRKFVNEVIDIELAYVNTNHPDFISMDDVFTERANHHSQAEMYQQVANDSEEDMEITQKTSSSSKRAGSSKQPHGGQHAN